MIIVRFIGLLCVAAIVIVTIVTLCTTWQYISWFHRRRCKHCNHVMEYKGLKDDDKGGHYLFHCEKCGAWEEVPKSELQRNTYNHCKDILR